MQQKVSKPTTALTQLHPSQGQRSLGSKVRVETDGWMEVKCTSANEVGNYRL